MSPWLVLVANEDEFMTIARFDYVTISCLIKFMHKTSFGGIVQNWETLIWTFKEFRLS